MSVSNFPSALSGIFNSSDFIKTGTLTVTDAKAMFVSLNNDNELRGNQIFDASVTLKNIPRTDIARESEITDNKCFVTKKYTDDLISSSLNSIVSDKSDTICYGQQVAEYPTVGGGFTIEAPTLGVATTTNTTGYNLPFTINFPSTSDNAYLFQNSVMFDFNYYFYKGQAITGTTSASTNKAFVSTLYDNSAFTSLTGTSGLTDISARFSVTIKNGDLLVHCVQQTTNIWVNPTTTSNTQSSVAFVSLYNNSQSMTYNVINFVYVNAKSFQVFVGYPNQFNNPTVSGWIANLGFSCKLLSSNPCTSVAFRNVLPLTTPNILSNTLTGGAFFNP